MTELLAYLSPLLAIAFGVTTAARTGNPNYARWFAFSMFCVTLAAVIGLVYQPAVGLDMRLVLAAVAIICGTSGGMLLERSRTDIAPRGLETHSR